MYKTTTFCSYLEAWSFGRKYHFKKFGTVALGVAELYYKKHTVALGVIESNYKITGRCPRGDSVIPKKMGVLP